MNAIKWNLRKELLAFFLTRKEISFLSYHHNHLDINYIETGISFIITQ
jgi:hypothetical protein